MLITYLDQADEIAAFSRSLGARIVQLHGEIEREELKRLKTLDPALTVIKSLVVGMHDDKTLEASVSELSPFVDAFITDTFDPKTGASGATGKTHDWRVSRHLTELSDRPVILAGIRRELGLSTLIWRTALTVTPASKTPLVARAGRKSKNFCRKRTQRLRLLIPVAVSKSEPISVAATAW